MQTTEKPSVRFCTECKEKVHYCETIGQAREHAWEGHCIALDLGVPRRDGDLEPQAMFLGRASVEDLRREDERMQPDAVSAERERRKKEENK
jgi:hypothetical protein